MVQISKEAEEALKASAARGRAAWASGNIAEAETAFLEAWNALPEPRSECDYYGQSLSRGLVTFFSATGQHAKAYEWLVVMRQAYGGGDNPSVDFLAGTVAFDAGNFDEAFLFFDRLYKEYKTRFFQGEDRKYLDFYRRRTKGH